MRQQSHFMRNTRLSYSWRKNIWWVITRAWFDYIIIAIVLLNMIPAVWEMVYESRYGACKVNEETEKMQFLFEMINLAFTSIYLIEFGVKVNAV